MITLKKQLIMTLGKTKNGWELTKEMVKNSEHTFVFKPVVWNEKQKFKDYTDNEYKKCPVIGMVGDDNVIIEGNKVYVDLLIFKDKQHLWKGKFDNWTLALSDDRSAFILDSIEVF